jgi:hypothetical protein
LVSQPRKIPSVGLLTTPPVGFKWRRNADIEIGNSHADPHRTEINASHSAAH